MTLEDFKASVARDAVPPSLNPELQALWWDAHGDWTKAHSLVDELETHDAMWVHAYLHRKEGAKSNASYWYSRSGEPGCTLSAEEEWLQVATALLGKAG